MRGRGGWRSFAEWAVAFGLLAFALIAAASIGIFVLPFAFAALVLAARRNHAWLEALMGGLVGVGSIFLFVAYRNRGYSPCPPGQFTTRLAHGEHFSCGGFDPMPWLTIGALLTAAGFIGYLVSKRNRFPAAATYFGHEQPSGERSNTSFKEETNMRELRYPNESREYRDARESLLKDEQELVDKVRSVAERRRNLPPGGQLKEDYVFQWANDGKVGKTVKFSELFADKNTLLLYSFMFGPSWDNPCPSCTSLVDGFDRTWYQVTRDASFVAIAKAPAERINAWANQRGWSQIELVSGSESPYQADYKCQGDSDDMQWPVMHVFRKQDGKIFHFWGTEVSSNHLDTVWPYWNLMDFTPEGRPDIPTPPQKFRSEFLEKNYLNKE